MNEMTLDQCARHPWVLRGGPGHDYPCSNPSVTECALSECQHKGHCKLNVAAALVTDQPNTSGESK